MRKINSQQINFKNICDVMYEPDKDRYSILEYNGTRREIDKMTFCKIINVKLCNCHVGKLR